MGFQFLISNFQLTYTTQYKGNFELYSIMLRGEFYPKLQKDTVTTMPALINVDT